MAKIIKDLNDATRVRHFDIVFYGSREELFKVIHTYRSRIVRYAFIFHDNDVYSEDLKDENGVFVHKAGEPKVPHFHVIVSFFNNCTLRACYKLFLTDKDKPRVWSVGDMQNVYEYLIHKNDPDKYQYNKCDIVSDDLNYFEKLCIDGERSEADNKAEKIVFDLLAGVSFRVMLSRYGRDFVIHLSQYEECANRIRNQDMFANAERERKEAEKRAYLEELAKPVQQEFDFDKKVGD